MVGTVLDSDAVGLWWGLRTDISNMVPGTAAAACLRPHSGDHGCTAKSLCPKSHVILIFCIFPSSSPSPPCPSVHPHQLRDTGISLERNRPGFVLCITNKGQLQSGFAEEERPTFFWFSFSGHHSGCRYSESAGSQIP